MISNFETEEELLNYLMTSEFLDDELNPSEMRKLLLQFRYFYRSSHAKQESLKHTIDMLDKRITLSEEQHKSTESDLKRKLFSKESEYKKVLERDLTFKERLFGKVYEQEYYRKFHIFKK